MTTYGFPARAGHTVEIRGLDIQFPFEPYDVQKDLMAKVLECIDRSQNGLLESPTGTGKTLSLLCSAAAWQIQQKKERYHELVKLRMSSNAGLYRKPPNSENGQSEGLHGVPIIIYASRTHSQLSQAIRELKRSHYRTCKAVVLGSRDLMCVHEEVNRLQSSSAKITACHAKVHTHSCVYYNNVAKRIDDPHLREPPVVDIEDIVKKGKSGRFCPFYMSRELVKQSEIVFMPYNYLLDPKLRSSHGIDLNNAVIILDEGHNIAKLCEEAVSFELKSSLIASCIQEITRVSVEYTEVNTEERSLIADLSLQSLLQLKKSFLDFEEKLDQVQIGSGTDMLTPISALLEPLERAGFTRHSMPRVIKDLDAISTYLTGNNKDSTGCDKFAAALRVLSSRTISDYRLSESYKVSVKLEENKPERTKPLGQYGQVSQAKVFQFWCFNPAIGLDTLMSQNPRCIILSSGTLSPIPFLVKELQTPFPVQLSNPHIINDNQLFATVIRQGPNNVRLSGNFENRNDPKYLTALGEVVVKVCRIVPKGVLVFFPSYAMLEICTRAWETNGIWVELAKYKKVLVEPKRKDAFAETMDTYYSFVKIGNGACLMAVCRGKVSEGLDFADDNGRAVIITGIPYAPAKDLRVLAKKKYLDQQLCTDPKKASERVSGNLWYQLEACRALNQAIGRIIRHAQDYGAILLCDERCSGSQVLDHLSGWVRTRLKSAESYDETINQLAKFFGTSIQKERAAAFAAKPTAFFNRNPPPRRRKIILKSVSEQDLDLDNSADATSTPPTPSASKEDHVFKRPMPPKQQRTLLNSLSNQNELNSTSLVGFNTQIPVFTKSFAAFSKSSDTEEEGTERRKKIRIVTPTGSRLKTPKQGPTAAQLFWKWVIENVNISKADTFRDAIRDFHKTKDLQKLACNINLCFEGNKIEGCVEGFSKILSAADVTRLRSHLSKE